MSLNIRAILIFILCASAARLHIKSMMSPPESNGTMSLTEETLGNVRTWALSTYTDALGFYQGKNLLNDDFSHETSLITDECDKYLAKIEPLTNIWQIMVVQYLAAANGDLAEIKWKRHLHRARSIAGYMSEIEYVTKKLKKIGKKILALLTALNQDSPETLLKGQEQSTGSLIEIESPLQYPFKDGPKDYMHDMYERIPRFHLNTIKGWPVIPDGASRHLVYHGSVNPPTIPISCGAYDTSQSQQGHGLFVDVDPMHAPLDYMVGDQSAISPIFKEKEMGYIWEIEAVDFRGKPAKFPSRHCRVGGQTGPASMNGFSNAVNSPGWIKFTMKKQEDMVEANYFNDSGLCKCKLEVSNIFVVNRWMRNIIIDYHKLTDACQNRQRCPNSKIGTWD